MEYLIALQTDVGIKKETNQDSCFIKEAATEKGKIVMALICDGMGGLAKGEVASASLIKTFSQWFEQELPVILGMKDPMVEIQYRWDRIIKEQNQAIAAYGKTLGIQLGSTFTGMIIMENGDFLVGHVGDSRAYAISDAQIGAITEDQTVIAREIKLGRMTPEQAAQDPRRNVLLQCVGASRVVQPAFYRGKAQSGVCYMLCSDGFRHVISPEEIRSALAPANNPTEADMNKHLTELIDLNKFRHENDNITALLVKVV